MKHYKDDEIYYSEIFDVPVDLIKSNPASTRRYFDNLKMNNFIKTVEEYGIITPLTVRAAGDGYYLISGERRLRAAKALGLEYVPAIILEVDEDKSAILTLLENLQREDLSFFEVAEGYKALLRKQGITQEELGRRIGISQSSIANKIRLLRLPPRVKKLIRDFDLSERHARAMLSVPDEETQIDIIKRIHKEKLSAYDAEKLIEDMLIKCPEKLASKIKPMRKNDVSVFSNTVKRAVDIMKKSGVDANMQSENHDWGSRFVIDLKTNNENPTR